MIFRFSKKFLVGFLILVFVVPPSLALLPKETHASTTSCVEAFTQTFAESTAQDVASAPVSVPAYEAGQTLSSATTAANSNANFFQDCIEKPLALAMGKVLLTQMTNEMVRWIDSGFKGNPAFVTNPQQFFSNIGDQIAGDFILGSDLAFLCSPFQLQLKIALALNYSYHSSFSQQSQCTLSQVVGNVNTFFNDPFGNATRPNQGWAGWFSMTQNSSNNGIGAFLSADAALSSQIANAQNTEAQQLSWGGGFLSMSECTDNNGNTSVKYGNANISTSANGQYNTRSDVNYSSQQYGQNCVIKTPGKIIETQLSDQLGEPVAQLGLADDFDKILNALANQLFQQIFEGAGGLLGASVAGTSGHSRLENFVSSAQASSTAARNTANQDTNTILGTQNLGSNSNVAAAPEQNIALRKVSTASCSVGGQPATKLTDGDKDNEAAGQYTGNIAQQESICQPTLPNPKNAWAQVDLGSPTNINEIRIYERSGAGGRSTRGLTFHVEVVDANGNTVWSSIPSVTQDFTTNPFIYKVQDHTLTAGTTGNIVRVQADSPGRLEIAEIEVYPNTPPTISLLGVSPMIIQPGSVPRFVDPGYTAQDTEDGDLTTQVHVTGASSINTSTPSSQPYTVTYSVTDSGGLTTTVSRLVEVQQLVPGQ